MINIDYSTFPHVDIAVCVCAGPSIHESIPLATEYCKGKKTVVLCSNYILHPKTDYIVFIDMIIFERFIDKTDGKSVIINSCVHNNHKNLISTLKNKVYKISTDESVAVCKFHRHAKKYNLDKIEVKKNGKVKHQIGNAGMATIFAGHYFHPKEILVLGFEGPTEDNKYIQKYNGRVDKYSDATFKTIPSKRNYVEKMLVPFLKNKNIIVSAFKKDSFWNIDRSLINWI